LDVDVIAVDDLVSADPTLTLPHPHAAERAFVLVPWLDVQPDARLSGRPIRDLLAALPPDSVAGVRVRPDLAVD
jgi:2-amino-4-hydroxy-6-hydroxymethyldihydropteridine diphosphokinase